MKNLILSASLLLITLSATAQTTTDKKESPISFLATAKLGFAKISQDGNVDLNGNINGGDALVSFKLGKMWSLDTGVGFFEFDANPTIDGYNASLTNSYLQIPVRINADFSVFDKGSQENQKIFFTAGFGVYANTLLKQELQTISGNSSAKNLGWNFGFSSQIGAKFLISDKMGFRLGLESQSDMSKMKKDDTEQKIKNINALYFGMEFKF
ncbi:MAG: acyloxyacyl hydrolase [Flavobacterium sp.]|uniref:outer membrane beta-barrel protein n=1 Tax=Flavobacterium sp. TaxID=239 RepID=UPI00326458E6